MEQANNPKDLIMAQMGNFTRQQEILASYVLEHMDDVPFLAVPVLASRARVSEATVVRFAKRVGFQGYSELKGAFVAHLKAHSLERRTEPDFTGSTLSTVLAQEIAKVNHCLEINEETRFLAVTHRLAGAHRVFCFGAGASSLFAEYLAYLLTQIGVSSAYLSSRYSSPLEQLVTMEKGDLLCCLSFPPYSRSTLKLLEEARRNELSTLVICDRFSAPACGFADQVLAAPCEGMMFTNSMTALTALMNAMITQIGKNKGTHTLGAVDQINRFLDSDPDILT